MMAMGGRMMYSIRRSRGYYCSLLCNVGYMLVGWKVLSQKFVACEVRFRYWVGREIPTTQPARKTVVTILMLHIFLRHPLENEPIPPSI